MTSPIDTVAAQIGIPSNLTVRSCLEHGKFLVPKHSRFKCPQCTGLYAPTDGTGGNGDTACITEAKSNAINAMKHIISLGM